MDHSSPAQLLELFDHTEALADVGGWELDIDSSDVFWTEGTKRIFGLRNGFDGTLSDALSYFHPSDRASVRQAIETCIEDGDPYDVTVRIVTEEGRIRWVRVTGEPAGDGEVIRGAIKDVTEQKHNAQRLMVLNRVLRHNISNDLTVILGHADLLEDAVRDLEIPEDIDFSDECVDSVVSMVEPAEGMQRRVDEAATILQELETFEWSAVVNSATTIRENAEEIANISEKVREVERQVQATASSQYVTIDPILSTLADQFGDRYPKAHVTYSGEPCAIRGHPYSFERAVEELCENAIRHNDRENPSVSLSVTSEDQTVHIAVTDNGPGIPDMERETLRSGEETPLHHGSGIGLWLVNWLVGQQDGEIAIRSNEPRGTTVELTFRRAEDRPTFGGRAK